MMMLVDQDEKRIIFEVEDETFGRCPAVFKTEKEAFEMFFELQKELTWAKRPVFIAVSPLEVHAVSVDMSEDKKPSGVFCLIEDYDYKFIFPEDSGTELEAIQPDKFNFARVNVLSQTPEPLSSYIKELRKEHTDKDIWDNITEFTMKYAFPILQTSDSLVFVNNNKLQIARYFDERHPEVVNFMEKFIRIIENVDADLDHEENLEFMVKYTVTEEAAWKLLEIIEDNVQLNAMTEDEIVKIFEFIYYYDELTFDTIIYDFIQREIAKELIVEEALTKQDGLYDGYDEFDQF